MEFEEGAQETKRQKLHRLLTLLNERSDEAAKGQDKKKAQGRTGKGRKLERGQVPLEEIRKDFFSLIEQDSDLNSLLGSKELAESNTQIRHLREELLGQLLQLVETALISSSSTQSLITQEVLEQRLADLVSPSKSPGSKPAEGLSFVDSFLAERGNKEVLKKAIDFVKPFFLAMSE